MLSWVRLQSCTANTVTRLVIESPECQHMIWHKISHIFFCVSKVVYARNNFHMAQYILLWECSALFSLNCVMLVGITEGPRKIFPIVQEGKIALSCCWVYDIVCTSWNTVRLSCKSLFPGCWHLLGNCSIVLWKQGTYAKPFKKCKRIKQQQFLSHTAFMLTSHALQGWQKFQQTRYSSRLIKLTYAAHVSESDFCM